MDSQLSFGFHCMWGWVSVYRAVVVKITIPALPILSNLSVWCAKPEFGVNFAKKLEVSIFFVTDPVL